MAFNIIGIDAKSYPSLTHMEGTTEILLTVLVRRIEGTVKAYAAIVPDTSRVDRDYSASREWVARHGNPLRFSEAQSIWPSIKSEEYAG